MNWQADGICNEGGTDDKEETNGGRRVLGDTDEGERKRNFRGDAVRRGECGGGYKRDPERAGVNCRVTNV